MSAERKEDLINELKEELRVEDENNLLNAVCKLKKDNKNSKIGYKHRK